VALSVLLIANIVWSDTCKLTVNVLNNSQWRNDPTLSPPHWHVNPSGGAPVNGHGRALLAIYTGTDISGSPSSVVYLEPAGLGDPPSTLPIAGPWSAEFGNVDKGLTYTLLAWIDGNENFTYDVGEPASIKQITPMSDVTVTLTIRDDTDSDGMVDWWEMHWFNTLSQTALTDYDNDGLNNITEYNYTMSGPYWNIKPNNWDSDGDGMDDSWEVFYGLDPTSSTGNNGASGDIDGDGLNNIGEYKGPDGIGPRQDRDPVDGIAEYTGSKDATSPISADSDDDSVGDGIEVTANLTHPVHPMSSTNYYPRSLSMAGGAITLTDPIGDLFAFGSGPGTVEFWIYPQTDGDGIIYYFPSAGPGEDHFKISLENYRIKVELMTGPQVQVTLGGAGSIEQLPANKWSHVAFVWSPDNNSARLFVDGILYAAKQTFFKPNLMLSPPTILEGFSDGYIDELRVWNYDRTPSDIGYWAHRIYPAPGSVQITSMTPDGRILRNYQHGSPLVAYYRFDDAGSSVENFAFLNYKLYPYGVDFTLSGLSGRITTNVAVKTIGSDDGDGDGLPEWWVELHNLDQYREYYSTMVGPLKIACDDIPRNVKDVKYFRSFVAYASIGNGVAWCENPGEPGAVFHTPKTSPDFYEGIHSCYSKYVYLFSQPRQAEMKLYTPGMTSTILYVNGNRITPENAETNTLQNYDIASYLRVGRNLIYVRCVSSYVESRYLDSVPYSEYDYALYNLNNPPLWNGCDGLPYKFKIAQGKFDASLTCNGEPVIVRGDLTRADPRAVWHCQVWSTGCEQYDNKVYPRPDMEMRHLPGNLDYGLPANAERDNNPLDPDSADDHLDANYEYICQTNPRDEDSNDNGIMDGLEDFDGDGLVNSDEQAFGSDPWLPDTDDDGIPDGADSGIAGHPSQSLSPQRNLSMYFGGSSADYLVFPKEQRFALGTWTLEAWVCRATDENDGGIIIKREVASNKINYELGLGDGSIAGVNVPYVRFVSLEGSNITVSAPFALPANEWVHLAATYYNHDMKLFVNGTNAASRSGFQPTPPTAAGGPLVQQIGLGFKGWLDDVRIWSVSRTSTEILNNKEGPLSGLEAGLIAYYRFDDNTSYGNLPPVRGTSANNGLNGDRSVVAWTWGQVEDYVLKYTADWQYQWMHAASINGNVQYSTNTALVGPPRLQVFLEPIEVVNAGALWSYDGGATWNQSGYMETRLTAGSYQISCKPISGWISPPVTNITLVRGQLTVITNRYIKTSTLTVIIQNDAPIPTYAQWTIDGGINWRSSGDIVTGLTPGAPGYDIVFKDISANVPGYLPPSAIHVELLEGEARTVPASYVQIRGSLMISFEPSNVVAEARWMVSGNTNWHQSGTVVSNLTYGIHTVQYLPVEGYQKPPDENINIQSSELLMLKRTYTPLPQPTSIRVTILPDSAVTAGAQWRTATSDWLNSGDSIQVPAGQHTLYFKPVNGWIAPSPTTVTVTQDSQLRLTVTYYRVDLIGGYGTGAGRFNKPRGVAATPRYLYVADSDNHRIQRLDVLTGTWVTYGSYGILPGQFNQPFGICLDNEGNLWVADSGNHRIQKMSPAGVWTVFGTKGSGLGQFNGPFDIQVDSLGNIYVTDYYNLRVQKWSASGGWSIFVSSGGWEGTVRFPAGLGIDSDNNVYVSDYDPGDGTNVISRIQKYSSDGTFIGLIGSSSASAGGINRAMGLEYGTSTNVLYVADTWNNRAQARDNSGQWSVIIDSSVLKGPWDITVDSWGNVYIADTENNRILRYPARDTDGDRLPDAIEAQYGTDPSVADTDGDGIKDGDEVLAGTDPLNPGSAILPKLVLQNSAGQVCSWALHSNGSRESIINISTVTSSWRVSGSGDLDGDGIGDVVWQYPVNGQAVVWYMNADGTRRGYRTLVSSSSWQIRAVGDLDGDGIGDVVWQYPVNGQVVVWYMNADGTRRGYRTLVSSSSWQIRAVGDLDGDGIGDVVWQYPVNGQVVVWYMNADGTRRGYRTLISSSSWQIRAVGDLDGDGIGDLFWQYPRSSVVVWYMKADGTMRSYATISSGSTSWDVRGFVAR
jgi:sugar lactone lactonase YvrE